MAILNEYVIEGDFILDKETDKLIPNDKIEILGLSNRSYNAVRRALAQRLGSRDEIARVYDLLKLCDDGLEKVPNIGRLSIEEIESKLRNYILDTAKIASEIEEESGEDASDLFDNLPGESCNRIVFPTLAPDVVVIAPDFGVFQQKIYHRNTLIQIPDMEVSRLALSTRPARGLGGSSVRYVSQLVNVEYDYLLKFRNFGVNSVTEIKTATENYLKREFEKLKAEGATPGSENRLSCTESLFRSAYQDNSFSALTFDDIISNLAITDSDSVWECIYTMLGNGTLIQHGSRFSLVFPSVFNYIRENMMTEPKTARYAEMLLMRLEGMTLEAVGQQKNVTRERVRQMAAKAVRIIEKLGVVFEEDRYGYIYSTYEPDIEFFTEFLGVDKSVYRYLNERCKKGERPLSDALEDTQLDIELRRKIEKWEHRQESRNSVLVDGIYIPKTRHDIENYVLMNWCRNDTTMDEFCIYYRDFIEAHGLGEDENLSLSDSQIRTRGNKLALSRNVLWKQGQKFRYYDIDAYDYSELFETLDLGSYINIELSTKKFMNDFPFLMAQYDMRDEYELHNLIKKLGAEARYPNIKMNRMPYILFGEFDRDEAVREILFELAPISQDDLAQAISERYGAEINTVKANWLNSISEYYHQGIYSVEFEPMSESDIELLSANLSDDFYYIEEIKRIYKETIPSADLSLISSFNLKRMGFKIGSNYAYRNYSSVVEYFHHLLTSSGITDARVFNERFNRLTSYSGYVTRLKDEYEIIEFSPLQYIHISRLEKLGFSRDNLRAYCDDVIQFICNNPLPYFTLQTLKRDGFESALDALGFDNYFYESILKEDARISYQRFGNTVIFSIEGGEKILSTQAFLVSLINNYNGINIYDFTKKLSEEYGIDIERHKIVERVAGTQIYYDRIMEKLYPNYQTYFEEI